MIPLPEKCPECGGPVRKSTDSKSGIVQLYCTNLQCPGRLREDLVVIAGRDCLEIDGLGPELAAQLVNGEFVTDLADLFEFGLECRAKRESNPEKYEASLRKAGLSVAAINKMSDSLCVALTRDWDRWIMALNIDGIGKTLGKQLVQALSIDSITELCPKLLGVGSFGLEGFGDKKVEGVVQWASNPFNQTICSRLAQLGVQPKGYKRVVVAENSAQPCAGMAICITGEHLGMDREVISQHLASLGAVMKSGVSKKCTHLLVGVGAGRSKLTKADELGIVRLSTGWLKELFEKHGVVVQNDFEMDVEI